MRVFLIISLVLFALFFIFQSYIVMATNSANEQPYKVLHVEKDFEIRFYPAAIMATIVSPTKSYKELANPGFRKLATYIFGGNETKMQIAMTAPVHMDINDTISSMSFVMPSNYTKEDLPKPNDSNVTIKSIPDEYVAALKFGGYASDKNIKIYTKKLAAALKEKSIPHYGNFRFLGYNPPYQFFGRRNEIIVSVIWK